MTLYFLNDHKTGFIFSQNLAKILNRHNYPYIHRQFFELINFPGCHIRFNSIKFTGEKKFSGKVKGFSIIFPKIIKNIIELLINNKIFKDYLIPKAVFRRTHLNFWNLNSDKDKYIVFIRDPREIIISGYLYHKNQCTEKWCINRNSDYFEEWEHLFPKKSRIENENFLKLGKNFSHKQSYKEKLSKLSVEDGIIYEMQNVAYITIMGMYNFKFYKNKNVLKIINEDIIFNFDETINKILNFFDMRNNEEIIEKCQNLRIENIIKEKENHITNLEVKKSRYKIYWSEKIQKKFEEIYPNDLITKLDFNDY